MNTMLFNKGALTRVYNTTIKRHASQLAFIGVGNMGSRMVTNLIKKGESVQIFDIIPENCRQINNATICKSPAEAAENASIIITMLPNGETVKSTILGDDGVLKTIRKNSLIIDCSTIEPKIAQNLADITKQHHVRFIDAPVSGGITGAEAGTLTFMVGGDEIDLKSATPILNKMGQRILHCGNIGAGQITKLCNNLILGVTMIATAEAMNLGIKLGLDGKKLASVVNVSSGRSWTSDTYNPVPGILENVPASRDYSNGFAVKLMIKDLNLAEDTALASSIPTPTASLANQIYRLMLTHGYGLKDFGSVYQYFKGQQ